MVRHVDLPVRPPPRASAQALECLDQVDRGVQGPHSQWSLHLGACVGASASRRCPLPCPRFRGHRGAELRRDQNLGAPYRWQCARADVRPEPRCSRLYEQGSRHRHQRHVVHGLTLTTTMTITKFAMISTFGSSQRAAVWPVTASQSSCLAKPAPLQSRVPSQTLGVYSPGCPQHVGGLWWTATGLSSPILQGSPDEAGGSRLQLPGHQGWEIHFYAHTASCFARRALSGRVGHSL